MRPAALYPVVLVGSGLGWGSTQALGKMAVATGHGPWGLMLWQLVVCALVLGKMAVLRGGLPALTGPRVALAAMLAVVGTLIPNAAFYTAVAHLPAGVMSIIISTIPFIAFLMALALRQDRFSAGRALGLVAGFCGVLALVLPEASLPDRAMVAFLPVALVGPLFYALESNLVARVGMLGMNAVQTMFLASAIGVVMCAPIAWATGQVINPLLPWGRPEWAVTISSVVHALAYASYVWLAAHAGAVFAAQSSYFVTLSGVVWAMVLLGERFSPWVWAALVLVLAGLALVTPRPPRRAELAEGKS